MIEKKISIVMPVRAMRAPINTVEACLRSLICNSKLPNEIIVVKDRFDADGAESKELNDWLNSNVQRFNKHNIKVVDCPKTEKLKRNELGAYIAGNYGAEIAENDWVLLYSDCDFYYHTNWDVNLMNTVERVLRIHDQAHLKYSFTPILTRAVSTMEFLLMLERGGVLPENLNANDITKMSGCLYFNRANDVIKESEINQFCDRVIVHDKYTYERCGDRNITSYFPNIIHKELLKKLGGMPEDPSPSVSCDLMFDSKLHDNGIIKVTPLDSILIHTYKTPMIFDITSW